jgi:VCBS repeat-containing protein
MLSYFQWSAVRLCKVFPQDVTGALRIALSACGVALWLLTIPVQAAHVTLAWDDPQNPPAQVGGYNLYYWQGSATTPVRVNAGKQLTYTLTTLVGGQTYAFAVTAYDGNGGRESALSNAQGEVSTTLPPDTTNTPPVATNGVLTTVEDTPKSGTLSATDANGHALTYRVGTQGSKGTAVLTNASTGAYTYTPLSNATGTDAFTFRASDGLAQSNLATVTVTITPVNDAPMATAQSVTTAQNTPVALTLAGSDVDGDTLTFAIVTGPANGTLSGTPPAVTYTPKANFGGTDSFTFRANDGKVNSASATVTLTITGSPAAQGLVAAYSFDDGSGTTVADASGNGHTGTISGATWSSQGKFGGALAFDGSNDWVTIADTPDLDLTTEMTLEAWVYPAGTLGSFKAVVGKQVAYRLYAASDSAYCASTGPLAALDDGITQFTLCAPTALALNVWTHLAMTYDGNTLRLYVNGQQVASAATMQPMGVTTGAFMLGASQFGEYFPGRIDNVRVYNRALSASELQTDMQTPVASDTLDTDGDGYSDALERHYGTNPAAPTSKPTLADLLETGDVTVDHNWKRVTFVVPFLNPVVVARPLSNKDAAPAIVRLRNVGSTGFDIRVQEWDYLDSTHATETVSYLAMERGHHPLANGTMVEAGRFDTASMAFSAMPFSQAFKVTPVVLAAVASYNGVDAVIGRLKGISTTGFSFCMQEQEFNAQSHDSETVAYIAWEPSAGPIDGLTIEVNKTGKVVTQNFATITFTQPFAALPVFLADMQTTNGRDPADLRWQNKRLTKVEVKVAEEQSKDSETDHNAEVVGYVVIK